MDQTKPHFEKNYYDYILLKYLWHKAPPCSSWDTLRVVPLIFSPGVNSLNLDIGNCDTIVGH